MTVITIARYCLLGALLALSLIILGISAGVLGLFRPGSIVPTYLALDLAIATITLIVVVPSIVVNFFRKGAFTSMVAVELGWASLLMILWIAAAGETTVERAGATCVFVDAFGDVVNNPTAESTCRQVQAVLAFSWLNFIILLVWLITLISLAGIAHSRGNPSVWISSVTSTDFYAYKSKSQVAGPQQGYQTATQNMQPVQPAMPMQQQNTGYSQGYPPTAQYSTGYNTSPSPNPSYAGGYASPAPTYATEIPHV